MIPGNYKTRVARNENQETFNFDLAKMIVGADIPPSKLRNHFFLEFLKKYTLFEIPGETVIREKYIPRLYDETLQKMRGKMHR